MKDNQSALETLKHLLVDCGHEDGDPDLSYRTPMTGDLVLLKPREDHEDLGFAPTVLVADAYLLEWGGIGGNITEQQLAEFIADLAVKSEMAVIINANTVIRAPEALYQW